MLEKENIHFQVDKMKKDAMLVAQKEYHGLTSLLTFLQSKSKCLVMLMIFFAFVPNVPP